MIRCIVFDFDGTLVDSNEIKRQAFFAAAREFDPDGGSVRELLERNPRADRFAIARGVARSLSARGPLHEGRSVEAVASRIARAYTEHCETEIARCPEIPGARAALAALSAKGIDLFVNSGTPTEALIRVVALRGLDDFFRGVYGSPESKFANLGTIRRSVGVAERQMALVGDGEDDRRAAQAFGCHFVGITRPGPCRFERDLEHAIESLEMLTNVLNRLCEDADAA